MIPADVVVAEVIVVAVVTLVMVVVVVSGASFVKPKRAKRFGHCVRHWHLENNFPMAWEK